MAASDIINTINATADSPGELQDDERVSLMAACNKLVSKLETPREAGLRMLFVDPMKSIVIRLAVDTNLFDAAVKLSADDKSEGKVRADDLAAETGADKLLVVRIMRMLISCNLFEELGKELYKVTPLGSSFVSTSLLSSAVIHMTNSQQVTYSLPDYFASKGFKNPNDAFDCPFQFARNTDQHYFDWLPSHPRLQQAFNVVMGISRTRSGRHWSESFPAESKLRVPSEQDTMLIDVGGGIGHDLLAFRKVHASASLPGKLVVQDIPAVIDTIDPSTLPSDIQAMKHDFFSPQPIHGARAYYLANVLHDWPDKQALMILRQIVQAMGPDSMVLINENCLPDTGVSTYSACADLNMMSGFGALERTEEQFRALLDEAGLVLVEAWKPVDVADGDGRRLLEAVLKK